MLPSTPPSGKGKEIEGGGMRYKYTNGENIEFRPDGVILEHPPAEKWKEIEYDPKSGKITRRPKDPGDKTEEEKPNTKDGKPIEGQPGGSSRPPR